MRIKKIDRFLSLFLAFTLVALSALKLKVRADSPPSLSAEAAVLADISDGGVSVLYEKNAEKRLGMASTTKLMTALVAVGLSAPETKLTIPPEAVGVEGSSVYLVAGESLTLSELLRALLLSSANDAAVAIAVTLAGSVEAFAELMNEKAMEIGLSDTHFVNPHGLYSEDHYTTALDLARVAAEASKNQLLMEIMAEKKSYIPHCGAADKRLLVNHNRLLSMYEYTVGGKTGFTKKTGRCLVSIAEKEGLRLAAVTLNAPDDWRDHISLFEYGFSSRERVTLYEKGEFRYDFPLSGGVDDTVRITNTRPIVLTRKTGDTSSPRIKVTSTSRFATAPLLRGKKIATLWVEYDGETHSSPLVAERDVPAIVPKKMGFFAWLSSLFKR